MNRKLPQKLAIPAALRRCFVGAAALAPGFALANPTGGQVVAGQATISNPAANGTLVNQSSQSAIVNWQQFNVAGNEYVQFAQPSSSAVILNRVIGGAPSEIFGSIRANGRVFLVNTQGVLFAPGAQVDVGALVASTLDIKNEDFLAGRYVFSGGSAGAGVTNEGTISAADGGFVVLQGDYAHNTGIVQAKLGQVVLAGGSATTLTLGNNGLVSFAVDEAAVSAQAGASNAGEIIADGGKVVMTAKVARNLVATAVNNTGRVSAQGIVEHNGEIELTADGGDVVDSGTLDVSNTAGGGGSIDITSDGNIDLQSGARILASGSTHGGNVRVVADRDLQVRAGSSIVGTGGSIGGNAELSGHGNMTMRGAVDLGRGGSLTIDPTNLTIADGYGGSSSAGGNSTMYESFLEGQLQSGTNVNLIASNSITINALTTDGAINGNGFAAPGGGLFMGIGTGSTAANFVEGTGGTITFLDTSNSILLDGAFTLRGGTASGTVGIGNISAKSIDIRSAGSIAAGDLTANQGTISAISDKSSVSVGNVLANDVIAAGSADATVTLSAATGLTVASVAAHAAITNGSGDATAKVTLATAAGDLNVTGTIDTSASAGGSSHAADGGVTLSASGGNIVVGGVIDTFAGGGTAPSNDIAIDAGGNVTTGDLNAYNAGITITGNNLNIGTVSGNSSDGTVGNFTHLDLDAKGTLKLANTSITAGTIKLSAGQGNLSFGSLVANNGSVSVITKSGTVQVGNISTSDFLTTGAADASVRLSATTGIKVGTISTDASGGQTNSADASVTLSTSGGNVDVTGSIDTVAEVTGVNQTADARVKVSAANGIAIGGISTSASASGQGNVADGSVALTTAGGAISITGSIFAHAFTYSTGALGGSKATVSITNNGGNVATSSISTIASGSGTVADDITIKATGDINTGDLTPAFGGITVIGRNINLGSLAGSTVNGSASIRGSNAAKSSAGVVGVGSGSVSGLTNVMLDASGTLAYSNTSLTAGTISLRNGSGDLNAGGLTATTGGLHIDVAGNVTAGIGSAISANDLAIKAGGTINIANATVTVGNGATSFGADPALINAIKNDPKGQGINLPPSSSPNAAFKAQSVRIGTITVAGGYLYIQADDYGIGQVNGPLDSNQRPTTLLNVLPYTAQSNWTIPGVQLGATGLVAAGNTRSTAATTTATGQPTLVIPPGIGTVAFGGSAYTGNIVVPAGTVVSPDTTNLVFATQGTIANANALSTSGVIVLLGNVITGLDEVPLLPQNYKPGFDNGIGWLAAPGDVYYSGVNDSNEGLIEPQSDAEAVLVCGGVQ